jgi:hypothetical protein
MEERMQVLNLLEEGKINVDEAIMLFKALDEQCCPDEDECPEVAEAPEEPEEPKEPEDGN